DGQVRILGKKFLQDRVERVDDASAWARPGQGRGAAVALRLHACQRAGHRAARDAQVLGDDADRRPRLVPLHHFMTHGFVHRSISSPTRAPVPTLARPRRSPDPPAAPAAAARSRGHARSTRVLPGSGASAPSRLALPAPGSSAGPTSSRPGSSADPAALSAGRGPEPTPRAASGARTPLVRATLLATAQS